MDEMAQFKQTTRGVWARGDYHVVAELIWDVGAHVTARVDVGPGDEVLDVACGTGNAAIAAATRGASVAGLDPDGGAARPCTRQRTRRGRRRALARG
jgi:2-polyprenyl-3-methyl-5-hydroxy-6-metoxy-1,4-benzoquinol methylase